MSEPRAFKKSGDFRAWLKKNHARETELLVLLYKVHAAERGMTYKPALDEALCFGWIDGVRRGLDEDSFTIRFTPRKLRSIWSAVNIKRVEELEAAGLMEEPGRAAFRAREESRSRVYSFENKEKAKLSPEFEKKLKANKAAYKFFSGQAPWYQRTSSYWVMSAKREETREKRLETLIDCCARETGIPTLLGREKKLKVK
jgi:uncharacterized protein YdeI (YjbR/CyaY-like superfamily)